MSSRSTPGRRWTTCFAWEGWEAGAGPRSLVYLVDTLPTDWPPDPVDLGYTKRQDELVREEAIRFIEDDLVEIWPAALDEATGGLSLGPPGGLRT